MSVNELESCSREELLRCEKLLYLRDIRVKFAKDYHVNTHGQKMVFDNYPYLWELYNSLSPEIVLMGSTQSMKTEWAIVDHLACAFIGLSVFYVLPKGESKNSVVQHRIDHCVERVPEYRKIVDNSFFNNQIMKTFGEGAIKYVGSNVRNDFREFPADVMFVDEVDDCDKDNLTYGIDRLGFSVFKFKRFIGNPTVEDAGVHARYKVSNQKVWKVPCTKCGEFFELDWFETVVNPVKDSEGNIMTYSLRDRDWEPGCRRDVFPICPNCGGPLDRLAKNGFWFPKNPESKIDGYHIHKLLNERTSVSSIFELFLDAQGNPAEVQHFYNSELGLPVGSLGAKLTKEVVAGTYGDFDFIIEGSVGYSAVEDGGPCSMGIDVGNVLDVRISRVEGGKRHAVFIGKVPKSVEDLVDLCKRYHVEVAVIDAQPEAAFSQDFQDAAPCDVWLCRFATEGGAKRIRRNSKEMTLGADRTLVLDRSFKKILHKVNVLPKNFEAICDGECLAELCKPTRKMVEDRKGNKKWVWTQEKKDHTRFADTYDDIASDLMFVFSVNEVHIF